MKRTISLLALIVLVVGIFTACSTEPTLRGLVSVQDMITQLSNDNIEEAWNPVYESQASSDLKDRLAEYVELIDGRGISRCDCVNYSTTGDDSGPGNYEETTQYQITLDDQTILYAQAVCIRDDNGEEIISLELFTESPW